MYSFKLKWSLEKALPIIYLEGDITSEADPLLQEAYNEIKKQSKSTTYIFDFKKANYINSSGISAFIKLIHMHEDNNGNFIFIGLSEHLKKVMDIVGLTDFVKIYENVDSALKKYSRDYH